jgi:isoquinoline 1-oxidoreductase beta subunit
MLATRCDFIRVTTAAGLALGIPLAATAATDAADATPAPVAPSAWVQIAPAGSVTVVVNKAEMGQGIATALAMMVAEELDVPLAMVTTQFAPADPRYIDPAWGDMVTGGSTSVPDMYPVMRKAGATMRAMLIAAAAQHWGVAPATLSTKAGSVIGADGKSASYGSLATSAATLPVPADVTLKPASAFALIGTAQPRIDLPSKLNGTAQFGIDVKLPGMLYASMARSPAIGGTPAHVDATAAKKIAGVKHVVTTSRGVAVVATTYWAAVKGRKALHVQWNPGPAAHVTSASIQAQHDAALAKPGIVQGKPVGDVAAAMKTAHATLTATYHAPYLAHATMEPMNATASYTGDALEIWAPNQVPLQAQKAAAAIVGLPASAVTVHSTFLGGGFGRRLEHDYVADVVEVTKQTRTPVKLIWTREDDVQHDLYRSGSTNKLSGAIDANGTIVALHHHVAATSVTARWAPQFIQKQQDPYAMEGASTTPYTIANFVSEWSPIETGIPVGYWRAPGANANTFATESFIDELAHAAGKDPVAVRRALLATNPRALAVLDAAVAKAGYGKPLPKGHAHGVAMVIWAGSIGAVIAEVSQPKKKTIKVHTLTVAADVGQPINRDGLEAQLQSGALFGLSAALHGKITFANGAVQQANFDTFPVLRMDEAPAIHPVVIASTAAPTGAGELATPPVPAAVNNALFVLTGKRYRSMPLTDAIV